MEIAEDFGDEDCLVLENELGQNGHEVAPKNFASNASFVDDEDDPDDSDSGSDLYEPVVGLVRRPAKVSISEYPRLHEDLCEIIPPARTSNGLDGSALGVAPGQKVGAGERVFYPPERAPPLVDFIMVLTAFLVALIAAYYSISLS